MWWWPFGQSRAEIRGSTGTGWPGGSVRQRMQDRCCFDVLLLCQLSGCSINWQIIDSHSVRFREYDMPFSFSSPLFILSIFSFDSASFIIFTHLISSYLMELFVVVVVCSHFVKLIDWLVEVRLVCLWNLSVVLWEKIYVWQKFGVWALFLAVIYLIAMNAWFHCNRYSFRYRIRPCGIFSLFIASFEAHFHSNYVFDRRY